MSKLKYKLTLEVFTDVIPQDEDGNEVFLTIAGWQENYTQFNDMYTYPKVVAVEKIQNPDGEN